MRPSPTVVERLLDLRPDMALALGALLQFTSFVILALVHTPQFALCYRSMNVELPWIASTLIAGGTALGAHPWLAVGAWGALSLILAIWIPARWALQVGDSGAGRGPALARLGLSAYLLLLNGALATASTVAYLALFSPLLHMCNCID